MVALAYCAGRAVTLAVVLLPAMALLPFEASSGEVDGFRASLSKWVETRQILSEEESDWALERETLRASRDLLAREKKALEAEIADLEASNTAADDERAALLLERGEHQRSSRTLEEEIRAMEVEVLALVARFPDPLRKKLDLLLVQIPDEDHLTKPGLGQRLMNVLGILAQAEKFNDTATFVGETRALDGDEKVQVRTLYWGLGQAIYVDARGQVAGIGHPSNDGWVFGTDPDLAGDAELLLDIYEGNVDAIEFVNLPIEIR